MKQLKDQSNNAKNRIYCEIVSCIFETYNNSVRPHDCHIQNTESKISTTTIFTCNHLYNAIPNWKFVLHCCNKCPRIVIPRQDANRGKKNPYQTIRTIV